MDMEAWCAAVRGIAKNWTRLSDFTLLTHASKVMLKILQDMLQQYVNCELPDVSSWF